MSKKFNGKVVIVTGSSAGIGQAAAVEFGKKGASVVIHGQDVDRLNKTEELMLEAGVPKEKILKVIGSMEEEDTPKKIVDETVKKFGQIDVLINNAGAGGKPGERNAQSMESLDFLYKVNFRSVVLLTQLAMPYLEKTKGNVVNVSSIAAIMPPKMAPHYGAMKAALDSFTKCQAVCQGPKGVRVNSLNPGPIRTFIFERTGIPGIQDKFEEYAVNHTPLQRVGLASEMAKTLAFLASDNASYITGAILVADGGLMLYADDLDITPTKK